MPKYTKAQKAAYAKRMRGKKRAQKKFQLPTARKSVVRSLQPIIETKKFCGFVNGNTPGPVEHNLSIVAPLLVLIPDAYMNMQAESAATVPQSQSVSGNDIFSRYISTKLLIEYPANAYAPNSVQTRPVELIWGWCKPLNLTTLTVPSRLDVSRTTIATHVLNQVAEDFDDADDKLEFKDRRRRSYNIVGRKRLYPNNNKSVIRTINQWGGLNAPPLGGPPPIQTTVTWKTGKKVEFTKSTDTDPVGLAQPFIYPNQAYVPFYAFYNPDFDDYKVNETGEQRQIKMTSNSCHWFNDA